MYQAEQDRKRNGMIDKKQLLFKGLEENEKKAGKRTKSRNEKEISCRSENSLLHLRKGSFNEY